MIFVLKLPMDSAIVKFIKFFLYLVAIAIYMFIRLSMSLIIGKDYKGFRLVMISEDNCEPSS